MLETVVQYGTGQAAAIGQFAAGKTGTTSNYGDAWFVGWDSKYTVAVWVGYPDKLVPMTTDFNGSPVLGGTFPALIWHDFMTSALAIDKDRAEHAAAPARHGTPAPTANRRDLGTGTDASPPRRAPAPHTRLAEGTAAGRERTRQAPAAGTGHAPGCRDAAAPSRRAPAPRRPARPPTPRTRRSGRRPAAPVADGRRQPRRASAPAAAGGQGAGARRSGRRPRRSASGSSTALGDADARARDAPPARGQPSRAAGSARAVAQVGAVLRSSSMPSACVSLPGPRAELLRRARRCAGAAARASARARRAAQRADQHRRADPLGLADGVQQRVDAVGAVDVGAARRARTGCSCGASARRTRGRRARSRGRPPSRRSRRRAPRARPCSRSASRATSSTGRVVEVSRASAAHRARARASSSCSRTRSERGPALGDLRLEPGALLEHRAELRARGRRAARLCAASSSAPSAPTAACPPSTRRAHEPRDDAVGLAEGHAEPHQQVGHVGRRDQLVGRRLAHALRGRSARPRASRRAAASDSSSVSTASNRCSLSSCRSLL